MINHSVNDFIVIGIDKVFGEDTYRKVTESFWIKILKTFSSSGLNHQLDI